MRAPTPIYPAVQRPSVVLRNADESRQVRWRHYPVNARERKARVFLRYNAHYHSFSQYYRFSYARFINIKYRPENKEIPLETRYYLIKHIPQKLLSIRYDVSIFSTIDPTFMFSIMSTFISSIITFIFIDFHIPHPYFLFIFHIHNALGGSVWFSYS